ncbi:MAG: WD40/YVTN/BNR-like repeat-containing protein, partial [Gammaproteobacteria bacterium]
MRNRAPLAAALLLAASVFAPVPALAQPPSAGAEGAPEQDDPNARRRAMYEWYNDTAGRKLGNGNASDTGNANANARAAVPFSREYMRFLNDAAQRERERWSALMPTPESSATVGSPESTISAAAAATGTTWVEIGPDKANTITNGTTLSNISDSGRVRSIVPHPTDLNTLYVAFSGGGVWKTTNATVAPPTWTPLTETLGSLSVGSLAMDIANPDTLYLGLGDPFDGTGLGVYKTTDGGTSWSGPVYLGNSTQIPQMLVAPTNSSIVLAATDAGLYRSTNGGTSFSKVTLATGQAGDPYVWSLAATGGSGMVLSLEAAPAATTGTTDGQIWRSTDNGATWTKSTGVTKTGGVGRITVAAGAAAGTNGATTVVYALAATPLATTSTDLADVFKSTNGGTSFTALSANTKRYANANAESRNYNEILRGQGWYNHMIIVSPTNSNTVYTGGALLTARTTDGFSKVTQISNWLAQYTLGYLHADMHAAAFSGSTLYVGSDGGIFRST